MPRFLFSRRELNYLRAIYIVVKIFPLILRKVFKKEWSRWTSTEWRDDSRSGHEFWRRESNTNKAKNQEKRRTIQKGYSNEFDSTLLFYLILNSDSVGGQLWRHHRSLHDAVNELRKLRNEIIHRSNIELPSKKFETFLQKTRRCFRKIGFSTDDIDEVETMNTFNEEEVDDIKEKLKREKRQVMRYKDYFRWRNSYFQDFIKRFDKNRITAKDLKEKGLLSEKEVEKLDEQTDKNLKNAMLFDCILYKGQTASTTFLNVLHQTDTGLPESFANALPYNSLASLTTVSPGMMQKARCPYPQSYKTTMIEFTTFIYGMDWRVLEAKEKQLLQHSEDWSVTLFEMIEIAYGYIINGKHDKAIQLLDYVTQNATWAGNNCARIISRAYARKSLHYIHVLAIDKAEFFATEAKSLISNINSPEEEILSLKRVADSILYGDGSVKERKERLASIHDEIIDLCYVHQDDIPRCRNYLQFVYQDKVRLSLGFSRHGFTKTTLKELEEGEKHLERLEQQDMKSPEENTYPEGFIFVCKSIAAYKRGELIKKERKALWKQGKYCRSKAQTICDKLPSIKNNGLKFMIGLLDKYVKDIEEQGC